MNVYRIIRTFGVVVLLSAGFVQCSKVNERMRDDETSNHFRTTQDNIPDSDMAPVGHDRYKRSDENLLRKLTDYGKTIEAYLNPSDGKLMGKNTPVWLAFSRPNGTVEYRKMQEGIVGIAVSRFYASRTPANPSTGENPLFGWKDKFAKHRYLAGNKNDASRVKRSDKEIVYPSLLVQTYYKEAKTRPDDLDYYEEIVYQLAFWNAVDLRFRQASNPEIRIHISGIIIGLDPNVTPYLGSDAGDVFKIWDETIKYWYTMSQREDFPAEAYHIVMTMTDTDIHNHTRWPAVIAKYTACNSSSENRFHSVAIIRDNGGFDGILSATHALGDSLGAQHDIDVGDECNNADGFIMQSQQNIGPKNLEWSPCSLNNLSYRLRLSYMNCFDEPAEFHPTGDPVQKVLPGDVLGPHKQCQGRGYDWACVNPDICTKMECFSTNSRYLDTGSFCKNTGPLPRVQRVALDINAWRGFASVCLKTVFSSELSKVLEVPKHLTFLSA